MIYCELLLRCLVFLFFFFNDTATTEIYTLSLHDALPIYGIEVDTQGDAFFFVFRSARSAAACAQSAQKRLAKTSVRVRMGRSEEHTSELQSPDHLVCRLLLEKKKKQQYNNIKTLVCIESK